MKVTAAARCLKPGCDWAPPEGTPADVDRAAERHTVNDKHPTATVMRPVS